MESRKRQKSPSEEDDNVRSLSKETLKQLYADNFPSVAQYITHNSGSQEQAKDIFQEALIAAWLNVSGGRYTGRVASLGGYIFTIAKHKWLDKLKSKSHRSTMRLVSEEVEEEVIEDLDSLNDNIDYLNKLYAQLDEKCQHMLKKFYFDKMSLRDIAVEMGVEEASLRTMKYRCMMKLRKMHLSNKENQNDER